jgi:serine/threonine-protein kinase RsbW
MAARRLRTDATARLVARGEYEWDIASDVAAIDSVVSELVSLCRNAGFTGRHCRLNVPVAVTEALANAVMRGNRNEKSRTVHVAAHIGQSELVVDVTDQGNGFDPLSVCFGPDDSNWLEREDGRGLFLMRSLMDEVHHRCEVPPSSGHTVRLVLRRA